MRVSPPIRPRNYPRCRMINKTWGRFFRLVLLAKPDGRTVPVSCYKLTSYINFSESFLVNSSHAMGLSNR